MNSLSLKILDFISGWSEAQTLVNQPREFNDEVGFELE